MATIINGKLDGKDNYGKPKQIYVDKILAMTDEQLFAETKQMIWLSAYANNNPKSDYHWQVDACYDAWCIRSKKEQYEKAYNQVKQETCS